MSSSYSSLARYRPAILAITAVAAGCTIYYIHNVRWSAGSLQRSPGSNSLRRSNALRRNRPPRDADPSESNPDLGQAATEDVVAPDSAAGGGLVLPNGLQPTVTEDSNLEHQVLEERETVVDTESMHSWRDESDNDDTSKKGQSLLNLLYRIAEEQATKEGFVHRGVTCNSCNTVPIRGIRYRCANCVDFDLCETCESMAVHPTTHLFYKVRIPAPLLGNPRQPQPVWYPGKPTSIIQPLSAEVKTKYSKDTGYQFSEIQALWEQFRCLAGTEWVEDPDHYHLAIDRPTFDKCFVPNTTLRPPPPNLIYDRMFAFYDTNRDGLIGFAEFLKGLSSLTKQKWDERRRKIFDGYDINDDGYVDRKDFLRLFRAFYALSKEMTREVVTAMDEDLYEGGGAREIVTSSQPVSSAFAGAIIPGERSRTLVGKVQDENGDYVIQDDGGAVKESGEDTGDHNEAVADVVEAAYRQYTKVEKEQAREFRRFDESMLSEEANGDVWPPTYVIPKDVVDALNRTVALEDVEDPSDREKIQRAAAERIRKVNEKSRSVRDRGVHERWQRQQYYLDDEDGALPPDGFEQDDTAETQPPSRRSRSSSKVRFQDDLTTDDEHETRSATSVSSRSIPVGERWGGYEVPEAEKDVGREILYQVAQESLNELLDPVFQQREDLAIMARQTKRERELYRPQISTYGTETVRERVKKYVEDLEWKWRNLSFTNPSSEEYMLKDLNEWLNRKNNQSLEPPEPMSVEQVHIESSSPHSPGTFPTTTVAAPGEMLFDPSTATAPIEMIFDVNFYFEAAMDGLEIPIVYDSDPEIDVPTAPPTHAEPHPDPTLPQNRPNSANFSPSTPPQLPSPPPPSTAPPPPTPRRLNYLIAMDMIEADDVARGGPGRLSFLEFEELLMGTKGGALGFVGSWVEMASF